MKREDNNIEELLVKYLLGAANTQEHLTIRKWRQKSVENEKYFTDFKLIWESSKSIENKSTIDEKEAWERLKPLLKQTVQEPRQRIYLFRNIARLAATIIVCVGGYFLYDLQTNKMISVLSGATIKIQTLPDGSVITLNKNSSILYPKTFDGNTRQITLSGEAFFNITPNKTKPFIIEANGVEVKVVGTSFNIKTRKERTEVIVETGIVEVSKKKNSVRLHDAEKAIVTIENLPIKDISKDALHNYYRTNEFVCNNTPLWRLVEVLNEAYNANIIIGNPSIKNLPLTTTFKNENLNDILTIVSETLNVTAERKGSEIILQ